MHLTLSGSDFDKLVAADAVRLRQTAAPNAVLTATNVILNPGGGVTVTCDVSLAAASAGTYDVELAYDVLPGQAVAAVSVLPAAFTVTPASPPPTPTLAITAPTGTVSRAVGAALTVNWTSSVALSSGEFGVWLRSAAQSWYIGKLVAPAGGSSHTTDLTCDVPAASGYKVIVAWRATAGTGTWSAFATSPGA